MTAFVAGGGNTDCDPYAFFLELLAALSTSTSSITFLVTGYPVANTSTNHLNEMAAVIFSLLLHSYAA